MVAPFKLCLLFSDFSPGKLFTARRLNKLEGWYEELERKELTAVNKNKDHMVNFPVLFHAYNL